MKKMSVATSKLGLVTACGHGQLIDRIDACGQALTGQRLLDRLTAFIKKIDKFWPFCERFITYFRNIPQK